MNMKKTVRKMSAVLTGATMIGATVMGAMALDLSDYPSPFIQDGFFEGKIVIGEKAQPIDTIGATDIAAAMQADAVTPVGTGGTVSTTDENVQGGYLFSEGKELIYGSSLADVNPLVDDTELPTFLAEKTIENDDDTAIDYNSEIAFTDAADQGISANINSAYDLDDTYTDPVLYYDFGAGQFYTTTINFDDSWSSEDFTESQELDMFGQLYTFDPNNDETADTLTLYGTESQIYIEKGAKSTVEYNGKQYTVEVLGGNTNANPATVNIRVGTATDSVAEDESETIGGLPVYVKKVIIDDTIENGANVAVELFIGSNKIELNAADRTVTMNGKEIDDVVFTAMDGGAVVANWDSVDELQFNVTPSNADPEVEFLMNGKDYVDPVFGSFKFHLGEVKDLTAGKEQFKVSASGDYATVTFTPVGGDEYELDLAQLNSTNSNVIAEDHVAYGGSLLALGEDSIFLYNDASEADNVITHVLQVANIKHGDNLSDTDFAVEVKDLTFGNTYTLSKCEAISSDIALYPNASTEDAITFTTNTACNGAAATNDNKLYTEAGANATISTLNATQFNVKVQEDYQDDIEDAGTPKVFTITGTIATDEYHIASDNAALTPELGDNDDVEFYMSPYGTFETVDVQDDAEVVLYVPAEEVTYDMWLAPIAAKVTKATGTTGTGSYRVNPLPTGSTILDKDAMNLLGTETPLLVVGGPVVNTVAAELMGNPTREQINQLFSAGTAKIKFYADKNALLVAGYEGQDTLGACYVLKDYAQYDLTGTEVEVVVPSLSSISVRTPQ